MTRPDVSILQSESEKSCSEITGSVTGILTLARKEG